MRKIKNNTKERRDVGFTIVELLIVIVIIGILAAITLIAFNGIQARARTSNAQASAVVVQKKFEAYFAMDSSYPSGTLAQVTTALSNTAYPEASLAGTGVSIVLRANITAANGQKSVTTETCTAPAAATGYRIYYRDYTTNVVPASGSPQISGGTNSTACGTWTAVS